MPQLGNNVPQQLLDEERAVRTKVSSAWEQFKDWALNDNVLEVALGLILASQFTAVVNSLVSDIILPVISLLPFLNRNLEEKFLVMRGPKKNYNTLKQALDDGALVWAWGAFLDKVVRFLLVAVVLFTIGKLYGWMAGDKVIKKQVRCKYCRKYISEKVSVAVVGVLARLLEMY